MLWPQSAAIQVEDRTIRLGERGKNRLKHAVSDDMQGD